MRTVFNYFDVGGKLPSAEISVNENVPFTTLFFLFVLRCFTLEQLSRGIYLPLLLPFLLDTYGYICAKGLKKSGLACCKRTGSNFMWQTRMQKAAADILEEGEVMVSHYLSILPQTVTMSNGSDCRGGGKGWDAGRSGMKAVDTGEGKKWTQFVWNGAWCQVVALIFVCKTRLAIQDTTVCLLILFNFCRI